VSILVGVVLLAGAASGQDAKALIDDLNGQTGQKQLEAAIRLGEYAGLPEVVTALSAKLSDATGDVFLRAACAASLGKSANPAVYPMLLALAKKTDEKAVVRAACINSVAALKQEDALPDLVPMLKGESGYVVQRSLVGALTGMKNTARVVIEVTPLLKDETAAPMAITILGTVGGPEAVPPLAQGLKSEKAAIRQSSISALGAVRQQGAVAPLIQFYPTGNDAEKDAVLAALANYPLPETVKLLLDEFRNPKTYPALRRRAALSLGNLATGDAVEPMVKVMLNTAEHAGLRLTCAQALGKFRGDGHAMAGLIGALADTDKGLVDTAALSLANITGRFFGTDKAKWEAWFRSSRSQ
jgi:HEAT repeat protein